MKKILLQLTVITILMLQACGQSQPLEETKLEKFGLTITIPKNQETPEFMDLKVSETDTELARYDFHVSEARVNVIEIVESAYPVDTNTLKKVVAASKDFIELIEAKQLTNGAFGVIFKMKGSSGATIKNYLFYFKKGNRFFKMEPVFNNDLEELDKQLAAFESMK